MTTEKTFDEIKAEIDRLGEADFIRDGVLCRIMESTTEEELPDGTTDNNYPCYLYDTYASDDDMEEGDSVEGGCCTGNLNDCMGMLDDAIGATQLQLKK